MSVGFNNLCCVAPGRAAKVPSFALYICGGEHGVPGKPVSAYELLNADATPVMEIVHRYTLPRVSYGRGF